MMRTIAGLPLLLVLILFYLCGWKLETTIAFTATIGSSCRSSPTRRTWFQHEQRNEDMCSSRTRTKSCLYVATTTTATAKTSHRNRRSNNNSNKSSPMNNSNSNYNNNNQEMKKDRQKKGGDEEQQQEVVDEDENSGSSYRMKNEFRTHAGELINPYQVLQVSRIATKQIIRQRFHELSRRYHPDVVQRQHQQRLLLRQEIRQRKQQRQQEQQQNNNYNTLSNSTTATATTDSSSLSSSSSSMLWSSLEEAREEWERIRLSYEILIDPRRRRRYERNEALADPATALKRAAIQGMLRTFRWVGRDLLQLTQSKEQ